MFLQCLPDGPAIRFWTPLEADTARTSLEYDQSGQYLLAGTQQLGLGVFQTSAIMENKHRAACFSPEGLRQYWGYDSNTKPCRLHADSAIEFLCTQGYPLQARASKYLRPFLRTIILHASNHKPVQCRHSSNRVVFAMCDLQGQQTRHSGVRPFPYSHQTGQQSQVDSRRTA